MMTRDTDPRRRGVLRAGRSRRIAPLLLTIACLALARPAAAEIFWVGAQMHFPVPARDIGDTQLGADAGVTFTLMPNRYIGFGADVIHHYWPASAGFKADFDRYLSNTRLEALQGPDWAMTADQFTAHVRLAAPAIGPFTSWVQVGAGFYRLNLNLDERRTDDTFAWVEGPDLYNVYDVGGGYGSVGLDFKLSRRAVLGVDATLHRVQTHHEADRIFIWQEVGDLPDFHAFTIGTHVMFGW